MATDFTRCVCGFQAQTLSGLSGHKCLTDKKEGFTTKDSGKRATFKTGMVRDLSDDKDRYDLVWMPMLKRWAQLMGRGAKKYTPNNWKKACTQEELDRFKESAIRHFMQWFNGEAADEDHAAAVFFNISGAEYVKDRLGVVLKGPNA